MASILKVDDLRGNTSAGDITITSEGGSATMQLQQGVAKSFVNGNFATNTVNDSLNFSSIQDNASGRFNYNLTDAMSSTDYVLQGAGSLRDATDDANSVLVAWRRKNTSAGVITTTSVPVQFTYYGSTGNFADAALITSSIMGDLA
jgi:hypothetical protein